MKLEVSIAMAEPTILDVWSITAGELTEVVRSNPSLRGMVVGYLGEFKLRKVLSKLDGVTNIVKPDDHDRSNKADLEFTYRGEKFTIEVKSLQTNSIKQDGKTFTGNFQCDASDRRTVHFPNHTKIETTCLLVNQFDILAVPLFGFEGRWHFAFAHNRDLPRSRCKKYTEYQQERLLATSMRISIPLQKPYVFEIGLLLEELYAERRAAARKR
jgi:hypothetical protein